MLLMLAVVLLGLVALMLVPLRSGTPREPRVIALEARGMAFYASGLGERNPILRLHAGEQVRIILRNREPGMTHDFAVPSLNIAIPALKEEEQGEIIFRAPSSSGRLEYLCRPHAPMMKGIIEVVAW